MPTREVAAQFDEISHVYDETRDPLDGATVDRVVADLKAAGVSSVLEVGVGTGRVARPLLDRGVTLTGIDASRGMLAKAREKGLPSLVRGSGYHMPFEDRSFDGTLFVHVLHLLDEPAVAVREAGRVSRVGTYAIVHPGRQGAEAGARAEDEPRRLIRDLLVEQGFPMPQRGSIWTKERDFLVQVPPDSMVVVSEKDVTESLRSRVDRLAKRGHRNLLSIPPEALKKAIETARERVGDRTVTYRRVEALATWSSGRWAGTPVPT
jgi:ubiquinone/menaquinone biosynthesis C-methylase UbiE